MNLLKPTLAVLAAAVLTPLSAAAESWSCRQDNDVREVHVVQTTEAPAPCQVVYKKLTEGFEDQVLWNAQFDGAYCTEQAAGFVTKLEGWGWTCVETISDGTATN
jgi:hypothetical protein